MASACASAPPREERTSPESERLVSADFASAIVQIEALEPGRTTLQMDREVVERDTFGVAFLEALHSAGYAVRTSAPLPGDRPVNFSVTDAPTSEGGPALVYEISIGEVSLRRSYRSTETGRVRPAATMLVKGADATAIRLDDNLFDDDPEVPVDEGITVESEPTGEPDEPSDTRIASLDEPVVVSPVQSSPAPSPSPELTPATTTGPAPAQAQAQARAQAQAPTPTWETSSTDARWPATRPGSLATPADGQQASLAAIAAPTITRSMPGDTPSLERFAELTDDDKRNVKDIGASNFAALFDDYQLVRESVLVFGDDSLRLGSRNKWLIEGIVESFDPASDVFSVIGCSHGSTGHDGGNSALALERAARVAEALVYAGIPEKHVLEEGCWAGEAFSKMPSRGVVVALKRLAS